MRQGPVEIHATHGDADSPILAAADAAALEPEGLSPAAYVEYALDQCARHSIDVFVPVLHQATLVEHREEFAAVGTALLAPARGGRRLLQDKVIAYETVAGGHGRRGGGSPSTSAAAVVRDRGHGGKACFKPAAGAGGSVSA